MTVQTDDVIGCFLVLASEILWVWSVDESLIVLLESRISAEKLSWGETTKYIGRSEQIILLVITVRIITSLLCGCPENNGL